MDNQTGIIGFHIFHIGLVGTSAKYLACGSCGSSLVSLELRYSPQHKSCLIMQTTAMSLSFFLLLFFCFFNLEFRNLLLSVLSGFSCVLFCSLSCPSFFSFLLFFLFPVLFSPVYSLISLVFFSNLLYFLFYFPITLFCLLLSYVLLLLFNLFSFY